MNSSYYPPGVTGNEPIFQGAEEQTQSVECDAQEDLKVIPSFAVKTVLRDLITALDLMQSVPVAAAIQRIPEVEASAQSILDEVEKLEDLGEWTCTFSGDVEVVRTGADDGEWACPVCGTEHSVRWDEYTHEDYLADLADRQRDEARGN